MAENNKDLVAWLADVSEGAIQRISEAPGADRVFTAIKGLGDRVDEMAKPKPARKPASAAKPKVP